MLMIPKTPPADLFTERIRELLQHELLHAAPLTIAKHANVYMCGDRDEWVYFIERGQIKLLVLSPDGKQCLLAIYTAGDIFGELCFAAVGRRRETATAMEDTILKQVPRAQFFQRSSRDSLLEEFVRYLTMRIADQQQVIANLVMGNSDWPRRWCTLPKNSATKSLAAFVLHIRFHTLNWRRWWAQLGRGSVHS
jgi:CRP/FNR family cyclic AMP-dependent transcriptional regulator